MIELEHFSSLPALGQAARTARGLHIPLGEEAFRVDVIRPDIFRLAISQRGAFAERPTFATAFEPPDPAARFELETRGAETTLETERLRLVVTGPALHVDVYRSDGSAVLRSARDAHGGSLGFLGLNDALAVTRLAEPSDSVYGLGQKTGPFERRGRSFALWNVDVLSPGVLAKNRLLEDAVTDDPQSNRFDPNYSSIPFFLHAARRPGALAAAGFFLDNGRRLRFDFEPSDRFSFEQAGGPYVEYVLAGPTFPALLEAYTFLTGRPALPPLYALGHHQCRWHDYDTQSLWALARKYRERGIPCDALWLDIGHMDGFRVFSFHPERFPEPERTFAALLEDGFRTVTIVDPGVKLEPGNELFEDGKRRDLFCRTEDGGLYEGRVWPGRTVFPDFVKAETREFWAARVERHARRGVSAIWNDMNEPATGAIEPFAMRFDRAGANHSHEAWHNQYALLMALATDQGLRAARPEERPFILSRAGFAGMQRVAAQWLGDHSASFDHLAMGLSMALGFGISGQPFVGGDVPGFAGHATPELAARWFQYAALTPFCRCHHQIDHDDHYPWSFGAEVESIARAALELRYRLLPYLYSAFAKAHATGEPVQRPLVFDFPNDVCAALAEDQYLFGEALLVAPVLEAGKTERAAYLPAGSWIEWQSGRSLHGEQRLTLPAPLGTLPLFARGGSVVPMLERAPLTTAGLAPELVELHVFVPLADGPGAGGVLYEDDGISTAHARGEWLLTRFEVERRQRELFVRATSTGVGYGGHRRTHFRVHVRGAAVELASLDGAPLPLEHGAVTFPCGREGFELRLRLRDRAER